MASAGYLGTDKSAKSPTILVVGPPCAGKGTQCKGIAGKTGLVHVSVGDLVRDLAKADTELGTAVKEYTARGDFVPDDMILNIVQDRLGQPDIVKNGVILDGFPRTREQAERFLANRDVDMIISFEVTDGVVKARALGRLQDPETGAVYHTEFMPPPKAMTTRMRYRDGDRDENAMRRRLEVHNTNIQNILEGFKDKARVVDGDLSPAEVYESMRKTLSDGLGISIEGTCPFKIDDDDWSDDEDVPQKPAGSQVQVSIGPSRNVAAEGGEHLVAVSLSVLENTAGVPEDATAAAGRVPSDVCCVIDISGSMRSEATYEDENENVKSDGLSYLDIVKHAVKTVMHMLEGNDRCALVAFDDRAEVAFPLDFMTAGSRTEALKRLDALQPRNRTNIWLGLQAGLDALRTAPDVGAGRPKTILLLTDGVPNEVPKRGHIAELRDYRECHPDFGFVVNTFGFGYNLDSELLLDLAVEGQGTYDFIPDALILGTCFVDSMANVLSTLTQKATVHLKALGGARFTGPLIGIGEQMVTDTTWGRVVNLGPLQCGGSREVVVPLSIPAGEEPYLEAVLVYSDNGKELQSSGQSSSRHAAEFATKAAARTLTVDVGYASVRLAVAKQQMQSQDAMAALATRIGGLEDSGIAWISTLKGDVEGRVSKSLLGAERFNRWGKHYLRAFTRAHQLQYCTNFMDKSLQDYGGILFKALREEGDSIFVALPPPQPSINKPVAAQRRATAPAVAYSAPAPDMSVYYGGSGGG